MSDDSDSNYSDDICCFCGGTPCDWEAMQTALIERGDKLTGSVSAEDMKKVRIAMCHLYIYTKFGSLVKTRVDRVPECVMREIRGAGTTMQPRGGSFSSRRGSSISWGSTTLEFCRCLAWVLAMPLACITMKHPT
ncbi:hypothetical protein DVH05_008634 [Phytophthora capsici]|nr:hypothetical protein DVH05_008634 [Phytophthora capsici]